MPYMIKVGLTRRRRFEISIISTFIKQGIWFDYARCSGRSGGESRREKGVAMGQWFQRFVASGIHGEVSDATIQGYLRSASQLEEIWQQIDDRVDALIAQGMAPWDAYTQMGYALAY